MIELLAAKILLTIASLGYGVATIVADLNKTHASNPLWTPHARFHVVWQVLSYNGISLLALALIWFPGPMQVERLYLVCAITFVVVAAFYLTWAVMPMYGGSNFDQNGYPPIPVTIAGRQIMLDANLTALSVHAILLAIAFALILAH